MMADFIDISPLISPTRRKRKRKRPYDEDPFDFNSDSDNSLLLQPRKKGKISTSNNTKASCGADLDLCSTDSENNEALQSISNSSPYHDAVTSIASDKSTQNAKKKKKKKKHKEKRSSKNDTMNDCIICNKNLRELSPERQQLHINSCLDVNEREKSYSYSIKYECPICGIDLTLYDKATRSKHMKQCLPDAQKNADDAEFEENPLQSLEDDIKQKKKNVIVTTELKNIYQRKFVCFMCEKELNRFKLKGRCKHLKQCAKKTGKDVYAVCSLIGIQRDIIDNPQNYEDKFNACYYKQQKRQTQKKQSVDIDVDDLSVFAFNKGNKQQILVSNSPIKQRKDEIKQEWNGFMDRMTTKKRKIGVNDYDKYIKDILNDLSETNALIKKMEQIRQHLEIKLQRTKALKQQHEDLKKAEQQSILESVSPTKCSQDEIDFKSQFMDDIAMDPNDALFDTDSLHSSQQMSLDAIPLKRSSVDRYNMDLLSSQPRNNKNKRNLWNIAQAQHKVSPSQFRVSGLLKSASSETESVSGSVSCALNTTQCLLDGLLDDTQDDHSTTNSSQVQNNLVAQFFNEENSEARDTYKMDQNDTFPINLQLSPYVLSTNENHNNSRHSLHINEDSMQSNQGSLFGIDESQNNNSLDFGDGLNISQTSIDIHANEKKNGHKNEVLDTLDVTLNDANDNDHELDLSFTMSAYQSPHNELIPISNFCELQQVITPILPQASKKEQKRMFLPQTPAHEIPVTPMIGARKEKVLKALNLYFETPEAQRYRLPKPVQLPPDIPGRKEYVDKIQNMSLDELKAEMKKYGMKHGSKLMMTQRLEMAYDALHPNSPMIRMLNKHIEKDESVEIRKEKSKEKDGCQEKKRKKTAIDIEMEIIDTIAKNDELLLRISTFTAIKFEEIAELIKGNEIKISKKNLQKFLDQQGICFILPEAANAVKGPRKRRKAKRK